MTRPTPPLPSTGSLDGTGAGDHDQPFTYHRPTTLWHTPFNEHEFARLLILRGRVQDQATKES